MNETSNKLSVKTDKDKAVAPAPAWLPFEELRREIDRLFDDGNWLKPFRGEFPGFARVGMKVPAVDIVEHDTAFEITVDLPGYDSKDVSVTLRNGNVVIKGEKSEEKQDKAKDYYLKERQYGAFERSFAVPETVDTAKVDAAFRNGVLTVTLPKSEAAQAPEQKVEVKAA